MNDYEKKVLDFHKTMQIPYDAELSAELLEARHVILLEEIKELEAEVKQIAKELKETGSINPKTKANLMKEMADVQYVLSGTAITFNLPMEEVFNRVHESNMSKMLDGVALKNGITKVLKGPNYKPPFLDDLTD